MQYDERLRIKSQIDGLRSHMKSIKSRTNHQPTVLKSLLIAASLHAPEVAGNPQATKSVEVRRSDEMGLEKNVSSVDLVMFSFHLVFCAASWSIARNSAAESGAEDQLSGFHPYSGRSEVLCFFEEFRTYNL